jgi:2-keto-3-deoxy-L-arabinonate dehydratase
MSVLAGVWPVLSTPMDASGNFHAADADGLLGWSLSDGVAGVVVLGLASEALQLEEEERRTVAETLLAAAQGRARVIVGTTAADTDTACRLAAHAARCGAAGLMVAPPSAGGSGRTRLVEHYRAVSRAAGDCPLMVQDAPQFVGVEMDAALAGELRDACPTMVAIKSEGVPAGLRARLLVETLAGSGIGVHGGLAGLQAPEVYAAGGEGMLPGCETPRQQAEILSLWNAGRHDDAIAAYTRILPLLAFEMQSLPFVVACNKALLHRLGVLSHVTSRIGPPLDPWSRDMLFRHWEACIGRLP